MLNEALSLFLREVRLSVGSRPSYQIYASTLKHCAPIYDVKLGKALHSHVIKVGHNSCQFVCKALLNMYAKSKAFDDCHNLFSQIRRGGDTVTWNIFLSGFAGSGTHDAEVMNLFHSMHVGEENPRPNSITIAIILPVCTRSRALGLGRSVHSYAVKFGLESDTLVGNALISMYAKCGRVSDDAYNVFDRMPKRDVVSWNALIAGFAENKLINEAFELFWWMLKVPTPTAPNNATIANILPLCSLLEEDDAYRFGTEIHGYVLRREEIVADVSVVNALMSFYLRIGQMGESEALFRRMGYRDLVSWNSVMAGYASNGEWLKAVELFREFIYVEMLKPDCITILSILPACTHLQAGKQIHGYIIRHPGLQEDTAVSNALISFYTKCCDTEAASRTFSLICKRDLISWNSMLNAFAESQLESHFVEHLQEMVMEGIRPDSVTILTVLQFCATASRGGNVKEAHCFSIKCCHLLGHGEREPTVWNALIDAYAKCENMEYALRVFEILSVKRNVVTWNSIISGYVNSGLHDNAHKVFEKMSVRDLTTWSLMVRVYAENNCPSQALSLFHELQNQGMKPEAVTLMSLLPVCAQLASVQLLRQCHGYVVRSCFSDDVCLNGALLDLYSKCGGITAAYKLFKLTPTKDLVMFTAMIGGFAMHGMGEEALAVFLQMLELGLEPDHVIITAVLSACSHTGLVEKGLEIFESIEKVYGVKPTMEHYACAVDLLARGGRVNDAYSFVEKMPIEANASIWGTLLGACRNHQMVETGREVADRLFEMESNNVGNYVVMSNLYAANGRWDGVLEMRKLMKTRDLKKPAGCSWIEVEGSKNVFIAADFSHPQRSIIYNILSTLDQQIKERFQFTLGLL